ncbi:predicted protein [Botrytis cinerea T4]|uniref:Uncharacterized protein n=1 Tax=Botryotinia fuckeliana (strain T4) TaxID=999810 RepID=G2Y6C4_BOTF4|nr:predicted protein [Botrytis cinerea T4]
MKIHKNPHMTAQHPPSFPFLVHPFSIFPRSRTKLFFLRTASCVRSRPVTIP